MKILAAGCSFTAGLELPDCLTSEGISDYAYPALLGKMYNAEVTNISLSGGSNSRIFRKVIDETCKNTYDLIICGWTGIERLDLQYNGDDIASAPGGGRHLTQFPWLINYYANHQSYPQNCQTWYAQLISMQSYLKLINQKYVFLSMRYPVELWHKEHFPHLVEKVDSTYFLGWPGQGMIDIIDNCPTGPGGHPLELGHQRIAEKINEHIRHLGWFSRRGD